MKFKTRHKISLLYLLALALLILAWKTPFSLLIFPAFGIVWHLLFKPQKRLFLSLYALFALWNLATTYWIANAHFLGVIATVFINGALMAFALWFGRRASELLVRFPWFQRRVWMHHLPIVSSWMALEELHDHWGLAFPWLNLGHTFNTVPQLVQFYQWTGASGGSLWVLLVAASTSMAIAKKENRRYSLALFSVPIAVSLALYFWQPAPKESGRLQVAIVQPNIEANHEKWSLPERAQIDKVRQLLAAAIDTPSSIDLVVLPETFLPSPRLEGTFPSRAEDRQWVNVARDFGKSVVFGATTYTFQDTPDAYNRPYGKKYYTLFNTALFLGAQDSLPQYYHKGKLVAGGETMPFIKLLKPFFGPWAVELGGTSNTLGISSERKVFEDPATGLRLAPIICWENEFSHYATAYSRQGANLLAVITNDGWWGNTDGHRQHLRLSSLRAIEQRKQVVRSANTGISAFINEKGTVGRTLSWEQQGVLVQSVPLYEGKSLYVRTGNWIGKFFTGLFFLYLLLVLFTRFFRLKNR